MFDFEGERFELVAVVAMAKNRVIGADGAMPWTLPADLKRYRRLTMGRPMIMGRKTLQSIGRVLDGRDTIVLTRSGVVAVEGAHPARDPQEALRLAARCAVARGTNEIVIAGGAEIYALFMEQIDRIEMTIVHCDPDGDTRFPEFDENGWEREAAAAMERGDRDSASAQFVTWKRAPKSAAIAE